MKKYNTTSEIDVKIEVPGFHCYPQASVNHNNDVSFLEERHRHKFIIRARMPVNDMNREQEFFLVQANIIRLLSKDYDVSTLGMEFGSDSCEMIAENIAFKLTQEYELPRATVSVHEDDENGAVVTVTREE